MSQVQFDTLVRLGCGLAAAVPAEAGDLLQLAAVAQRFKMEGVGAALEGELIQRHLRVETCGRLLEQARRCGTPAVASAARSMALERFDAVAATGGFLELGEDALQDLLDDDALHASGGEEAVFRAAARWMRGGGDAHGALRGEGLLGRVRFALMDAGYLAGEARGVLPEADGLEELLLEAYSVAQNPFQARPRAWACGGGRGGRRAEGRGGPARAPPLLCAPSAAPAR